MKRLVSLLTLSVTLALFAALLAAPLTVLAQDGHGEGETSGEGEHGESEADDANAADEDFAPIRGAAVYAEFCQACHGPQGEAIAEGAAFPAIEFDAESAPAVIADGLDSDEEDGVAMPGFGDVLSEAQTGDLIAYMETWETGDTPPLPEPNITLEVEEVPDYFGDVHAGAVIYAKHCVACHGVDGEGRDGDAFPELEFEKNTTLRLAADGAENEYMPAFGAEAGGPLDEQQLTDLETYLASWQVEEAEHDEARDDTGLAVMFVLLGVVAILTVGAAYMTRSRGVGNG